MLCMICRRLFRKLVRLVSLRSSLSCEGNMVVPDDQAAALRRLLDATRSVGPQTSEAVRHRKDGSLLYVDVSTRLLGAHADQPERLLSVEKDVTLIKVPPQSRS